LGSCFHRGRYDDASSGSLIVSFFFFFFWVVVVVIVAVVMSGLVDETKSIFCCSSRFGESNLRPERIRNPVENVFVP